MNRFLISSAVISMALAGCSGGSVANVAMPTTPDKATQCNIYQSVGRRTQSDQRTISCGNIGSAAVDDFSTLTTTPADSPIHVKLNFRGYATVDVYQPNDTSSATITMTYANYPDVVTGTADTRSIQGAGGSIRDGVISWLVSKALDWATGHDVHGIPNGTIIWAVPNSSAPNGGQWINLPIQVGPNGLPPGWIPADQQNWGNPMLSPMAPPMPDNCGLGDLGPDCRNYK